MLPQLAPNDYVIGITRFFSPRINDIVIVSHPTYGEIIKRIIHVNSADQSFQLASDNASGISTSDIGIIQRHQIIAKMICHVSG